MARSNIRFPLLVKLAIIFLAVLIIPAGIVAIYVKQRFDYLTVEQRMERLEFGRASFSALLEEEWIRLDSQALRFLEEISLRSDATIDAADPMASSLGAFLLLNNLGEIIVDQSLACCSPEAILSLYSISDADAQLSRDGTAGDSAGKGAASISGGDRVVFFSGEEIVLVFRVRMDSGVVYFQASIGSHFFDVLRSVSGITTSMFTMSRDTLGASLGNSGPSGPWLPQPIAVNPLFSTRINAYGERESMFVLDAYSVAAISEYFRGEGAERDIPYNSEFIHISDLTLGSEFTGIVPLLENGRNLYFAAITVIDGDQSAPAELEYMWVIVSAVFILVLLMSLLITMYVVAPIMNLNQGVENLRRSVGLERSYEGLNIESNDEIGDLAASFNLLAQELTQSLDKIRIQRREILEYAQNLEDKVQERTREAEAARVRAEMANVHKSKFLVNMNHEFRTPLNSISGITDLLSFGAYDKNDEIAMLLEQLADTLGEESSSELLVALRDSLYTESCGISVMIDTLRTSLMERGLDAGQAQAVEDTLTAVEKLSRDEEEGKLKAYANIREAGKTLIHIVDDVINLSRIEAGTIDIRPEPCSSSEIVNYAMVHSESYCRAKGKTSLIQLSHSVDPMVPERIVTDHYRVKQVLMNLLSNAVKYTEAGKVDLVVRRFGSTLRFTVVDQGIGIAEKDQSLLFQEFGRTFNVRDIEGTGLGLTISRRLVEAMGGEIGFSSQSGKGSEFWFTIPLEVAEA